MMTPAIERAGYLVLAQARWPVNHGDSLPPLPGFILSSFSPLVAELAERCLRQYFRSKGADAGRARRIGIVVASTTGDIATAAAIARAVEAGRRVPPLLFFQSNPNAVAGYIAARWHLGGPLVCTIPASHGLTDALNSACLLIEDGDADAALVILADTRLPEDAAGTALLVGPPSRAAAITGEVPDECQGH
ncbi:MAG: beta-ketoacyl synthase chain length factor [Streptosporangiaceae bacterium]|jgi:3-oxoacyl-(acyl-carrier-protein) synthase